MKDAVLRERCDSNRYKRTHSSCDSVPGMSTSTFDNGKKRAVVAEKGACHRSNHHYTGIIGNSFHDNSIFCVMDSSFRFVSYRDGRLRNNGGRSY